MKEEKKKQKNAMKHVDLCSNVQLAEYDKPVVAYDTALNSKLWNIYELITREKACAI